MRSTPWVDEGLYSLPADSPLYWVHDLIRAKTDYVDILARLCSRERERVTHAKGSRIDYVYLSPSLVPSVKEARVVRDAYTKQTPHAIAGFYRPSDHLPILVDFRLVCATSPTVRSKGLKTDIMAKIRSGTD